MKLLKTSKDLRTLEVGTRVDLVTENSSHMFTNRNCIVAKIESEYIQLDYGNGKYKLYFDKFSMYTDGTIAMISGDRFKLYKMPYLTRDDLSKLTKGDRIQVSYDLYVESKYDHLRYIKKDLTVDQYISWYSPVPAKLLTQDDKGRTWRFNLGKISRAGCIRLYDKNSTGGAVGVINFKKI